MPGFPPNDLGDIVGLGRAVLTGGLGLNTVQARSPAAAVAAQNARPNAIVRNPRQAPTTFDIGGVNAVRPKGTFFARFKRAANSDGIRYWENDHGFLVKTVEQPTVTPKLEEINQYNRKRQVVTGYTFQPINITLFDTADAMVLRMWQDYAKYFFADFNQTTANYSYDIVPLEGDQSSMRGGNIGYGFSPQMDESGNMSGDTQFYFQTLEIYHVFRNAYTLITLVNPRISSFATDELDYSTMDPVTHRLQISYESVLYNNNGAPMPISGDLAELFGDIRLEGDIIDLPANPPGADVTTVEGSQRGSGPLTFGGITQTLTGQLGDVSSRSGLGGVLGSFGNFNFGGAAATAIGGIISGDTRNLTSSVLYAATGNAQLASIINMATSGQSRSAIVQQVLSGAAQTGSINPALYDAAAGAFAAANGDRRAAGALAERVIGGILGGAQATQQSPAQQISSQNGVVVSGQALQIVNSARSLASQLGRRT